MLWIFGDVNTCLHSQVQSVAKEAPKAVDKVSLTDDISNLVLKEDFMHASMAVTPLETGHAPYR